MKKELLVYTILLLLGIAIVIPITIKARKDRYFSYQNSEFIKSQEEVSKKAKIIDNIIEYTGEIPEFSFDISGLYSIKIDDNYIKKHIPVYQFDAYVYDIYGTYKNTYIGFKYIDLMEYLEIVDYSSVSFISNRKTVGYRPSEIDKDKTFIVFYKDKKRISDTNVSLLAVNYRYGYSVEGLTEINFN